MASRRMLPTRFFKDPDIMNLSSKDTQLILIGLVLMADDEGREVAHAGLLSREMDYPESLVEAALAELAENDLLVLYEAGKHRYYQLSRWNQWQTLGGRITPSRYPAPAVGDRPNQPSFPSHASVGENPGNSPTFPQHFPDQLNVSKVNRSEVEGKATEPPPTESQIENIVPFPTRADGGKMKSEKTSVSDLAQVLQVPVTDALTRLVAEFQGVPGLSLLGEANAARAWLDDQRDRYHKPTQMTLPFFRRWLQRSLGSQAQQAALATGTTGRTGPARLPDLMHLDDDLLKRKGHA